MFDWMIDWFRGRDTLAEQHIGRICFRGDTRQPAVIFAAGFDAHDTDAPITFREVHADISPTSAVCVTPRFSMAAFFPGYEGNGPVVQASARITHVYALYLENGFATHQLQAARARDATDTSSRALQNLYAQEHCAKQVPGHHVIAAVEIDRNWQAARRWLDQTADHRYTVGTNCAVNLHYTGPDDCGSAALAYLGDMLGQQQRFPLQSSGFDAKRRPPAI